MSHIIHWIESPKLHMNGVEHGKYYDGTIDFQSLEVGDMCYYHYQGVPCKDRAHLELIHLTDYYFKHNSNRAPLILALPDRASEHSLYFLVDGQCYSDKCQTCNKPRYKCKCKEHRPKGHYDAWVVTGSLPLITVQPSVNYDDDESGVKHYHGHIKNGVIGDG